MKKQSGFTLIELVIVIIILGILSATAIPKFINLQGDARAASLQGVKAALESAATITYSKAVIDGVESTELGTSTGSSVNVDLRYGYPRSVDDTGWKDEFRIKTGLSEEDWTLTVRTQDTKTVVTHKGTAANTDCEVKYIDATSVARPTITAITTGC